MLSLIVFVQALFSVIKEQWALFPIFHFQNTSDYEFFKRGNRCRSENERCEKLHQTDSNLGPHDQYWGRGQLPDTKSAILRERVQRGERGETLTPNPNESNSDNIFWKWEMGKSHLKELLKALGHALGHSFNFDQAKAEVKLFHNAVL